MPNDEALRYATHVKYVALIYILDSANVSYDQECNEAAASLLSGEEHLANGIGAG